MGTSSGLAGRELGFAPTTGFADGMRKLSQRLVGRSADDRVDRATAAPRDRGLGR